VAADLSVTAIGDLGIQARATWNWLGVTMYLPPEATAAALRAIAAGCAGTTLVVNFLLAAGALGALGHAVRDCTAAAVAATGSLSWLPIRAVKLRICWARGDSAASSCSSPVRLRDRYLRDRPDLPLPGTTLIAVATVQR
jgi:O-methyltransferase involved in polyketide biosynthesis